MPFEPRCFSVGRARKVTLRPRHFTGGWFRRPLPQVVTIIEDNGWETIRLVNEVATAVLQEGLGIRVVYLRSGDVSGNAARVGDGRSHAVLEYWLLSREMQVRPELLAGRVRPLRALGYMGRSGLYALRSSWQTDPDIWWDYYKTYSAMGDDIDHTRQMERVAELLPRNLEANSVPPRVIHLDFSSIGTTGTNRWIPAHECTLPLCRYGQYYPPACAVNETSQLTDCPEIYFEYPQYSQGFYEILLAKANMSLTAVYLGDKSAMVIHHGISCQLLFFLWRLRTRGNDLEDG